MNCTNCGTALEPGEVFCGECGQSVVSQSEIQTIISHEVPAAPGHRVTSKTGTLAAIGVGLVLLVSGALIVWLLWGEISPSNTSYQSSPTTSDSSRDPKLKSSSDGPSGGSTQAPAGPPLDSATQANINSTNPATPGTGWGPKNERASFNGGERITYYPGSTPEQCQADCDKNARCRAFTFIRQGAYNRADPPMCYLMSVVKEFVTHDCCISAVKN